jgi:hypothetical protein
MPGDLWRSGFPSNGADRTGHSRDDMVVLKTGSVVVLPDHESGKVVMYLDRSKLLTSPSALWTQAAMYVLRPLFFLRTRAQSDGFIMLGVVATRCSDPID